MAKAIFAAFIAALLIKLFLLDFIIAEGNSMEPSIRSGTVLVINKLQYGLRLPGMSKYIIRWAMPKKGEIVLFYTPLNSETSSNIAVKRCIGYAGNGEFLVQGDNSLQSFDSRSYGPVPADNIIGKVLWKK